MAPPADPPRPPPAPAAPAFRVKGIIYRGTQAYFAQHVPGGLATLVAEIREPELAQFIQQPFLAGGFYDVLPVAPLIRYEARATRQPVAEYLVARTRYQAEKDIGSVYKFLLKLVSLEQVALRVPRLMGQLFDFGKPTVEVTEPGHVLLRLDGWPEALSEWGQAAFGIYIETALRLSGAKQAQVSVRRRARDEPLQGTPRVTLAMDIRFE